MLSRERIAAERLLCRVLVAAAVFFAAAWLIPQVWDKLSPFLIAIPIAAMLQPVIRFFDRRLKVRRGITSLVLVLLLLALTYFFLRWLVSILIETASQVVAGSDESIITTAVRSVNGAIDSIKDMISWENLGPGVQSSVERSVSGLTDAIQKWGLALASGLFNLLTSLPYFVIYTSFLAMALFFISRDYDDIRSYLPGGKRWRQDSNTARLTRSAIRSLAGYMRVQGTFSAMVLVVSLIYLHSFRFDYASAIAVLAGFMELIPMIGSGLLYILMGIIFLLTGNTPGGVQILLLTGFLQLVRRLLEPKLVSNSIGITPLESLIGMFAGLRFGGILGLIGGPVMMSVIVGALRGPAYDSLRDDLRCLREYFRRRWHEEPVPGPSGEPGSPPESPEDQPH